MMKRVFVVLLTIVLCLHGLALADEAVTFTVQGNAAVAVDPDEAYVTANVAITAESAKTAQERMSKVISDMHAAVKALGLTDDDIVTQSYSFYPAYNYDDGKQTLIGYQANHTVEITCHDVGKVDDVLNALTDSGVTEVYNVSYGSSQNDRLYRKAMADALAAARAKAEELAAACGYQTVTLTTVTERSYTLGSHMNMMREEAASDKAVATGINAGSVSVTASVEAVFLAK